MNTQDVFGQRTTYLHDYTVPKLEEAKRYHLWNRDPKTPEKVLWKKPYQPKDVHTMQPWTDPYNMAPFNTFWTDKDIVRTHPHFKITQCPKPGDPMKDEIIKTRPRLYMSPALSMDDISDKETRNLLVDFMYCTVFQQATNELNPKINKREIPNSVLEKCVDPVRGNFSILKPIPPECKKNGKAWETKQYTSLVDPHQQFWQNYKHSANIPVGRDQFEHTIPAETRKEIRDLIDKDELRVAFYKPKPGYSGYVPKIVTGEFRKQELQTKK